jgi:outer membrane lipoprotein SlyB
MKRFRLAIAGATVLGLLAGCATQPLGPTVAVMPGQNKSFDSFVQDQSVCTAYANQAVGGQAQVANNQAVGGAILGTALGAGLGAAAGGGTGAAIGAASGAVAGTALGAGYSGRAGYAVQQQYNIAYAQCMAGHGNQVPTSQEAYGPPAGYPPAYYGGYYPGYYYPYDYYGPWAYPYYYGPAFGVGFGFGCCGHFHHR